MERNGTEWNENGLCDWKKKIPHILSNENVDHVTAWKCPYRNWCLLPARLPPPPPRQSQQLSSNSCYYRDGRRGGSRVCHHCCCLCSSCSSCIVVLLTREFDRLVYASPIFDVIQTTSRHVISRLPVVEKIPTFTSYPVVLGLRSVWNGNKIWLEQKQTRCKQFCLRFLIVNVKNVRICTR